MFANLFQSVSPWKTKGLGRRSRAAGLILLFITHLRPRGTKRNQICLYGACPSIKYEMPLHSNWIRLYRWLYKGEKPPASELLIRGSVKQQASSEWIILNVYTCTHHFLLSDRHILSAWSLWRVPKDLSILSEGSRFTERIWKTVSLLHWAENSRGGIVLTVSVAAWGNQ